MDSQLIQFYQNKTSGPAGRFIADIWAYSFDELEYHHDFIQWLFPLPEKSQFNAAAPLLSQADIKAFKTDNLLKDQVLKSFEVMAQFYGFEIKKVNGHVALERSRDFSGRLNNWLTPGNHNFLRISRILRFLSLIAQKDLALAFFKQLQKIHRNYDSVIGRSFDYWKSALA